MRDGVGSAIAAALWIALALWVLVYALPDLTLLVGYSVLLAYILLPLVKAVERIRDRRGRHLPRALTAGVLVLGLLVLVGWLVALAVPRVATEAARFAERAPEVTTSALQGMHDYAAEHGLTRSLDPAIESLRTSATALVRNLGGLLLRLFGRLLHNAGQVIGLLLLPLLAFYLLAEADAVHESLMRFVPPGAREHAARLERAVDRGLRSYVRGQVIVCLVMGTVVGLAEALLGLPGALLLGLFVGTAELVPYLGFAVASLAIALAGLSVDSWHAVAGVVAYAVINWAIGALVTPRVMGRYLRMHPFIVTISILAGATLLGPGGALLALPGAAVLKSVMEELATPVMRPTDREEGGPPATAGGGVAGTPIVGPGGSVRRRRPILGSGGVAPMLPSACGRPFPSTSVPTRADIRR
jgi:predicted PurR-regulated permease PerM